MRIALYTDTGGVGGAEISLANLAGHLPAHLDVVLVAPAAVLERMTQARPQAEAIEVDPCRHPLRDIRVGVRHALLIRRIQPDVLHVNLYIPWCGWWAIAGGLSVSGTVVTAVEQLPIPISSLLARQMKRLLAPRMDAHLGVGRASARRAEELIGLPPGSMGWIHNGVPDPGPPARRPPRHPRLVAVGRLDPQKAFDVLLHAVARLPEEVTLSIIGEGSQREELEKLARALDVDGRVRFVGWSDEVGSHLAEADVFVLPSRDEGFPLSIAEAMLARLPVVATRVGSVDEAVEDGGTGYLVERDDPEELAAALAKLTEDPDLRLEMGERGRERGLAFTSEAMAASYVDLWESLVEQRHEERRIA